VHTSVGATGADELDRVACTTRFDGITELTMHGTPLRSFSAKAAWIDSYVAVVGDGQAGPIRNMRCNDTPAPKVVPPAVERG
jgi:hypothetical protein